MVVAAGCDPSDWPWVTTGGGEVTTGVGTTGVGETWAGTTESGGPGETETGGWPGETESGGWPGTGGWSTETTTGAHDTDSGSTPEDFACQGQEWMFIEPDASGAGQVSLANDGRARVVSDGEVRHFDAAGTLVTSVPLPYGAVHWDIDAAGNGYAMFRDDDSVLSPRKWLRKFDPAGAMVWERDLGPREQGYAWGYAIAVAADGTTVYSDLAADNDGTRLVKHAADGTPLWDIEVASHVKVVAIGASGTMAALVPNSSVRLLDAAGAELWSQPWQLSTLSTAAIDGAGNVVVGATVGSSAVKIGKFAPDGTLLWQTFLDVMWQFGDLAVNASGEIAVGGHYNNEPPFRSVVARLDASGTVQAVHVCGSGSWETDVAIDDAGTIFASGAVDFAQYHMFATAFD